MNPEALPMPYHSSTQISLPRSEAQINICPTFLLEKWLQIEFSALYCTISSGAHIFPNIFVGKLTTNRTFCPILYNILRTSHSFIISTPTSKRWNGIKWPSKILYWNHLYHFHSQECIPNVKCQGLFYDRKICDYFRGSNL